MFGNRSETFGSNSTIFMDKLYRDLTQATGSESFESVHLAEFPKMVENFVDKSLESKMMKAQTVSSLVLSLRKRK